MLARETFEGPQVRHNREQFCRIAERDWLDGGGFEVRNSRFSELQTLNLELLITPFSHVSLFAHHGLWHWRTLSASCYDHALGAIRGK
jgi:hypothetical protein